MVSFSRPKMLLHDAVMLILFHLKAPWKLATAIKHNVTCTIGYGDRDKDTTKMTCQPIGRLYWMTLDSNGI